MLTVELGGLGRGRELGEVAEQILEPATPQTTREDAERLVGSCVLEVGRRQTLDGGGDARRGKLEDRGAEAVSLLTVMQSARESAQEQHEVRCGHALDGLGGAKEPDVCNVMSCAGVGASADVDSESFEPRVGGQCVEVSLDSTYEERGR